MGLFGSILRRGTPSSRDVAKTRLQLVLVHDRVDLSPQRLQILKDELIAVISRHVEIDVETVQVTLNQNGRQCRLTADMPVLSGRPRR